MSETTEVTPDTRMVTDREAAAWLSWLDGVAPKPQITVQGMLRAQLADRGRWMALAAEVERGLSDDCCMVFEEEPTVEGEKFLTTEGKELLEKLRKLLKEAHGE